MGLPGTPSLLSALTSSPVTGPAWDFRALEISVSVLVSVPMSHCVGAQPFLQFSVLPTSSPERRMGQSPCPAQPRRKPGGSSHPAPGAPAASTTSCPPAPGGSGHHRKRHALFLSCLLTQTHLDFICLRIFHFLFWKVIRVLHVPFFTKETGKRGECPGSLPEGASEGAEDPAPV